MERTEFFQQNMILLVNSTLENAASIAEFAIKHGCPESIPQAIRNLKHNAPEGEKP